MICMINNIPRTVDIRPAEVISVIPLLYLVKMRIHSIIRQQLSHLFISKTELLIKTRICNRHYLEIVESGKYAFL